MSRVLKTVRRTACGVGFALASGLATVTVAWSEPVLDAVRGIEQELSARVGFYMHDLHSGDVIGYNETDRFPLNSTFKLLACAALLHRVDLGQSDLTDTVPLRDIELVSYSPAIEAHIQAGSNEVSFGEACQMMLSVSDNTAANIVLAEIGGPEGLTNFQRSIGDPDTRLDRWETDLNEARPGDPRDTTTPQAMARSVQQILVGNVLSPASRTALRHWLSAHKLGDDLFRATLPPNWKIEDRTGAGGYGSRSIVAVFYPPARQPIIATLFMTETTASFANRNAAAARVGTAIISHATDD